MREIDRIILHCTATESDNDVRIDDVRKWHTDPVEDGGRGWSDVGYHYLIRLDGTIEVGRPLHKQGAHTRGHNGDSIGIAYAGGLHQGEPTDTLRPVQERAFITLCHALRQVLCRPLVLHGHREFSSKSCPCFDMFPRFTHLQRQLSF